MFRLFVRSAAIAAGVVVGAFVALDAVMSASVLIDRLDRRRPPYPPADDRGRPLSPLTGKPLDLGGARS